MEQLSNDVFYFLHNDLNIGMNNIKRCDEFPNKYGANVSHFGIKYNFTKDSYNILNFVIRHDDGILFVSNHGYFPFSSMDEIKQKIKQVMEE